jgi:hypothetical protein
MRKIRQKSRDRPISLSCAGFPLTLIYQDSTLLYRWMHCIQLVDLWSLVLLWKKDLCMFPSLFLIRQTWFHSPTLQNRYTFFVWSW